MSKKVRAEYVVFTYSNIIGSNKLALEKVDFGWKGNSFTSEEEAIKELIAEDKTFEDFIILKTVYIEDF